MEYSDTYDSPLGKIMLAADDAGLTGLLFEEQTGNARFPDKARAKKNLPVFDLAKKWLDIYFSGNAPKIEIPLRFTGTAFQNEVWKILCTIPYGETTSYGEIAKILAARQGRSRMSAQAIGGAVGRNKILLIVPCHRVIGANGTLTGYSAGIAKKRRLLALERISLDMRL